MIQKMRKFPQVHEKIPKVLGPQKLQKFEEWIIKDSMTPSIENFEQAFETDTKNMANAPNLELPINQDEYSELVWLPGLDSYITARMETIDPVLKINKAFKLSAQSPT